ncbi:MAG: hypothetical protein CML22_07385 [Rheinheimera sp.]|nr:hypothetical protein [Rheinheimera sp.]MBM34106.1 hypothetical protein [Rheinheimera sp.]
MIETEKRKRVTTAPSVIGKKEFSLMIDKRLHNEIEQQSVHHNGVINLALRLACFVGLYLPHGKSTYLEVVLSQAISDWHAEMLSGNIQSAFSAYCLTIFKHLPLVLNYTVTGKTTIKPHYSHTWDCTRQTIYEWMHLAKLNQYDIEVIEHTTNSRVDPRDAAFLLCSKVFIRQELANIGITEDIYGLLR